MKQKTVKQTEPPDKRINITALTKTQLSELLTKTGSKSFSLSVLESDIAAGAPLNEDGTTNIIHYIAWLIKQTNEK